MKPAHFNMLFGPLSKRDLLHTTANTIPPAQETENINIIILSSPKAYHSIAIPHCDLNFSLKRNYFQWEPLNVQQHTFYKTFP
jgi:hypothetical protein